MKETKPPAADAGPRQPCAGGGGYGSCRDARDPELCANCEPAALPVPQEARELTKAEWKEIAEGPCEAEDDDLSLDAKVPAPDWAMREAPLKALRQWEADTEAPANASEGNAFIDGFNAGRQAGSERERALENGLRQILKCYREYRQSCDDDWDTVSIAEASRLLGGESK